MTYVLDNLAAELHESVYTSKTGKKCWYVDGLKAWDIITPRCATAEEAVELFVDMVNELPKSFEPDVAAFIFWRKVADKLASVRYS